MKKRYIFGLALCLLAACSAEKDSAASDVEQQIEQDVLQLADTLTASYNEIHIEKYEDDEHVGSRITLYGEDYEKFLHVLKNTTFYEDPLSLDRSLTENYYIVRAQGSPDLTTMFIEEENGEQLITLLANDIFPSGSRKATSMDILTAIKALEAGE